MIKALSLAELESAGKLVKCGGCGDLCWRKGRKYGGVGSGLQEVHTRTLLDGKLVPSCSEPCSVKVRQRAGLVAVVQASKYAL